jgi:hypothetical protein
MRPDFLQPIIPTLTEDYSQCGIGLNGPRFLSWAYKTFYYWYKMASFDETPEDKFEAETISLDYIFFFKFLKLTLFVWC